MVLNEKWKMMATQNRLEVFIPDKVLVHVPFVKNRYLWSVFLGYFRYTSPIT
jgi:hypothetical protein